MGEASDDRLPVMGQLLQGPPRPVPRPPGGVEVMAPSGAEEAAARTAVVTGDPGWCRSPKVVASSSPAR